MASIKEIVPSREWRRERNRESVTCVFHVRTGYGQIAINNHYGARTLHVGETYPGKTWLRISNKHAKVLSGNKCELRVIYDWHPEEVGTVKQGETKTKSVTEFDTTAQTHHITIDLDGAIIGGNLEGVDAYRPGFIHAETWYWRTITNAYVTTLYQMTATINKLNWKLWGARSLLFLGAIGRREGYENWRVDYRFMYAPDQPLYRKGIFVGWADGWDYVWNDYTIEEALDVDALRHMVYQQQENHEARVYPDSTFANLLIG